MSEKDAFDDILSCACRPELYREERVHTVIVDVKLVDDCLEKFKELPWHHCRPLGGKGAYVNSELLADEYAQQNFGVWVTVPKDSPKDSSSSSNSPNTWSDRASPATPATTPELEQDRSASRCDGKADFSNAAKSS